MSTAVPQKCTLPSAVSAWGCRFDSVNIEPASSGYLGFSSSGVLELPVAGRDRQLAISDSSDTGERRQQYLLYAIASFRVTLPDIRWSGTTE
jgi:hypothetical protein